MPDNENSMIGTQVGHYQIVGRIGSGGMGDVFLAEDKRLDRQAAIKFMSADLANDLNQRQRFASEAKAASALSHPHVCVVYDVGESDEGLPFIAMEYIEGDPLGSILRDGPIDPVRMTKIVIQIADALEAAHAKGIVHRDIKPANISLQARERVKVLDFGLAKRVDAKPGIDESTNAATPTRAGQTIGTPSYMSPEQALAKQVDHRSDLFSLGVVMFQMLTGQLPFPGESLAEIVSAITSKPPQAIARFNYEANPELERITLKCLQKSPERRYQSAGDLMVDLQTLLRDLEHGPGSQAATATCASSSGGNAEPPDPIEKLKQSQILLNYAAVDDQSLNRGKPGWVSELHRNLELRVEQLSGEKVPIGRLPASGDSSVIDGDLSEHLPDAKAMISVVSPPFLKSSTCVGEVTQFWQLAEKTGGPWVEDKARLLKVLKTAVNQEDIPSHLADIFSPLFGFEFFELDPETGRVREFDETFGPTLKQQFFERVYDLAYDVCQLLRSINRSSRQANEYDNGGVPQQWIYLATTTSDVQPERDRIRRELVESGHVVLPDSPLPTSTKTAEAAVRESLEQCTMAVHLLGHHYGVTPEDSHESLPALQVRLSADRAGAHDLQRLIWLPPDCRPEDQRQCEFIRNVQDSPELHGDAEIIQGNLNLLKDDLVRRLSPPKKQVIPEKSPDATKLPKLYLICEPRDEVAVEALEDYLFEQGVEVCLPAFDGSDEDAEALHRHNLLTCDGVLVYYGAAPKAWVDIKLRELLKAAGYGRETPIEVQAVYVAPPDDRRKDRFRSHQAQIIRQVPDTLPMPELNALVGAVEEVSS